MPSEFVLAIKCYCPDLVGIIYNINPAIIINAGIIYIIDLIVPVVGKLTIVVGDVDILAIIISVGVAVGSLVKVGVGVFVEIGVMVGVNVGVVVGVDDIAKVGVGLFDIDNVFIMVGVGLGVDVGIKAAFC